MRSELIINENPWETRVALLENGSAVEFFVERKAEKGYVGNIYKGRVARVLPGMQAAFVEIGLERTAFIYVSDVYDRMNEFENMFCGADMEMENEVQPLPSYVHPPFRIEELLHEGQEILVQVAKGPVGDKGARVTSHISLPGRFLVLLPTLKQVCISRKIEDEVERRRLKNIIDKIRPQEMGFIVRTACEGGSEENILREMNFLVHMWENIQKSSQYCSTPCLLYEDLDISLRAARDLFKGDVERLVVDSKEAYDKITGFLDHVAPHLRSSVEFYDGSAPLFDFMGLEIEFARLLNKKIWLKSGGFIVIDSTEALTSIDVNTGKYVGKRNLEDTIFKTNMEAAKEIAVQLRLRNIGGIIIIDFIDMKDASNREEVFNTLREALKKDPCKTNILKMSEIGLIQMTRQRNRESIHEILCESCYYCEGKGFLKSQRTICYEIFRRIQRDIRHYDPSVLKTIEIYAHPQVCAMLMKEEVKNLEYLENMIKKTISIHSMKEFYIEQYEINYL